MAAELYHSMRKVILRYLIFFLLLSGLNAGESAYYIAANNRSDPLAEISDFSYVGWAVPTIPLTISVPKIPEPRKTAHRQV